MKARPAGAWLKSLGKSGMHVKSARDALQIKGYLDSGNYALNWAISGKLLGGYPLGHCGEIFGDPGTGKSFLAARAIAMAQKQGGEALLDDTEGAYNDERSASIGIDVDRLALVDPRSRTVKDHLAATEWFIKAVRETKVTSAICVLDSLAQLSTEHEMEKKLDKKDMSKAAELKAFYRIIGSDLFDLPVVHLATNHTIAAIGNMFQKRTTGGGGGPKFMASWRLDMRTVSKIRRGREVVAVMCRAVVDKNRFVAPWKEVKLAIPFHQPISRASGLVPLLVEFGIVQEQGNFLYKDGQKLGRNYKTKERVLEQDEMGEQLLDQYPELLEETDVAIAAGLTRKVISAETTEEQLPDDEGEDHGGD